MPDDPHQLDALRLHLVPGVGPRLMQVLYEAFGSPGRALAASRGELLGVPGVGAKVAAAILQASRSDAAERELARCEELGARILVRGQADYPKLLAQIPDAPAVLYCRGDYLPRDDVLPRDEVAVAIVGSRQCTYYGVNQAEKFAGGLARAGVTVVSGLARGIDAAAHRGALVAGGRTIAVTATGLETVYPPEHATLADEVAAAGAVLTEFKLAQKPLAGLFPQRNRVISGLSLAILVIEATRRSGALHTARHAMEQNRDLFALPGRVDSVSSEGCHDLIRDGAVLVRSVDDVLDHLGPLLRPTVLPNTPPQQRSLLTDAKTPTNVVQNVRELVLSDQERSVLTAVPNDPTTLDAVLIASELPTPQVLATLTMLEMKRLVRRLPGGLVVRVT